VVSVRPTTNSARPSVVGGVSRASPVPARSSRATAWTVDPKPVITVEEQSISWTDSSGSWIESGRTCAGRSASGASGHTGSGPGGSKPLPEAGQAICCKETRPVGSLSSRAGSGWPRAATPYGTNRGWRSGACPPTLTQVGGRFSRRPERRSARRPRPAPRAPGPLPAPRPCRSRCRWRRGRPTWHPSRRSPGSRCRRS